MSVLNSKIRINFLRPARKIGSLQMRMTPSGYGFIGLVTAGFLMSMNFSNNLIFAMTFLLISIALVGWWFTRINLTAVKMGDWKVEPVFSGRDILYKIQVENRSNELRYGVSAWAKSGGITTEVVLPTDEQVEVVLRQKTSGRGIVSATQAALKSAFPLGIFEARLMTAELPEVLVYPAPIGNQLLPEVSSGAQAHKLSEAGSYTDMKRYSAGDPLSRIHWKAFARFDELYTKEFDGAQGEAALWLKWENVQAIGNEDKLSQLCRWILDIHGAGREFGIELPGTTIEPAHGEEHLHACLTVLALYGGSRES